MPRFELTCILSDANFYGHDIPHALFAILMCDDNVGHVHKLVGTEFHFHCCYLKSKHFSRDHVILLILNLACRFVMKLATLNTWLVLVTSGFIWDTGQCQTADSEEDGNKLRDCRSLFGNNCDCPQPYNLRCKVTEADLQGILEKLEASDDDRNIRLLHITFQGLNEIKADTFGGSSSLDLPGLVISTSSLEAIQDGALANLRGNLTKLSLPNNSLQTIPQEVFTLPKLHRLDLSQNFIRDLKLPVTDNAAKDLQYLDLSSNHIDDINHVVLPPEIKEIHLKDNQITASGLAEFQFPPSLRKLILSNNKISTSVRIFRHGSETLQTLDLSFNSLVNLSASAFAEFPGLEVLNLKKNSLQLIDPEAFAGLDSLNVLDLSQNGIIELASSAFKSLHRLQYLYLSSNHLSVVNPSLTTGLISLENLDLRHNDIIRVEPLVDCEDTLTQLLLDSNPLDCSCHLKSFQDWLKSPSIKLKREAKTSARCKTPPPAENAVLYNLDPLTCDVEDYHDDGGEPSKKNSVLIHKATSPMLSLEKKEVRGDTLNLRWRANLTEYKCDVVQLYRENPNGDKVQFCTKSPSNCVGNVVEATIDLKKTCDIVTSNIHPVTSILACLSIYNPSNSDVLSNCTTVKLNSNNAHPAQLASIHNITAISPNSGQVDVNAVVDFEVKKDFVTDYCWLAMQLEAGDADDLGERVAATHKVTCKNAREFSFVGLRVDPMDVLRLCCWLELGPGRAHTSPLCVTVQKVVQSVSAKFEDGGQLQNDGGGAPILPLALTLVFLGVGIAALVVLYLIVRGYLSDRHKATLFRMRFSTMSGGMAASDLRRGSEDSQRHLTPEVRGGTGSGFLEQLTSKFFPWRSVPASDEMALREDSTFDTSVV